jgi:hypothetical protein
MKMALLVWRSSSHPEAVGEARFRDSRVTSGVYIKSWSTEKRQGLAGVEALYARLPVKREVGRQGYATADQDQSSWHLS